MAKRWRNPASRAVLLAAAATAGVFAAPVSADTTFLTTWIGPSGESWNNTANWSGGFVPQNQNFGPCDVFIDGNPQSASTVEFNYGNGAVIPIQALSVDQGDALNLENNDTLSITGPQLVNSGTISIKSSGGFTSLRVPNVTLSGGGTIAMGNNSNNNIRGETSNARFTNLDNTIIGSGRISGDQSLRFTNSGTVIANQSAQLAVLPAGTNNFNTGVFRAAGGTLLISGTLVNTGGTIEALDSSQVQLQFASITGGTLRALGTGSINVVSGAATLSNLSIGGRYVIPGSAFTIFSGTINNTGTIQLNSGTGQSTFESFGMNAATLSGGGSIIMSGTGAFVGGIGTLITDNYFRGSGTFGGELATILNSGWIESAAIGGGTTVLFNPYTVAASIQKVVNSGTLLVTAGSQMIFGPGVAVDSTAGTVRVLSGGTLVFGSNASLTSGGIALDGTVSVQDGVVNAGSVLGNGTLIQNNSKTNVQNLRISGVSVSHGSVQVKAGAGTLGTSTLMNLPTIGTAGNLDLSDHDLIIDYSGPTPIDSVRSLLAGGYGSGNWNGSGITSSQALLSPAISRTGLGYGESSSLLGPGGGSFSGQTVNDSAILIKYTYAGDANLDGKVDLRDLYALATHYNGAGYWDQGDFNYDGVINSADLALLARNWQANAAAGGASSLSAALASLGLADVAVPEPMSIGLLGLSLAGLMARRRSN